MIFIEKQRNNMRKNKSKTGPKNIKNGTNMEPRGRKIHEQIKKVGSYENLIKI